MFGRAANSFFARGRTAVDLGIYRIWPLGRSSTTDGSESRATAILLVS